MHTFTIRPATHADMDRVYEIRYNAYLAAQIITSNQDGKLNDIYDHPGQSVSFVLTDEIEIVGTSRVVPDSSIGIPMDDEGFGPAIDNYRRRKRRIIEGGRFAISPKYQHFSRDLSLHLALYTIAYATALDYDIMLIMVLEHHHKFYERILMFETIMADHKTKYGPSTYGLRLELDALVQRYENSRTAMRFKLPESLKHHQLSHTRNGQCASPLDF